MWRKFFKLFGLRVVKTTDHDGEERFRFLKIKNGRKTCIAMNKREIDLLADGETCYGEYVVKWSEV